MDFLLVLLLIQIRIPSNKENVKRQPWMENENGLFQTITISPLKEVWVQTMDVALHRQDTTYVGGGGRKSFRSGVIPKIALTPFRLLAH